jgi:ornithine cyclodeaminase/alanine dehydrogenase
MTVITEDDVVSRLTMAEAIDAVELALAEVARGNAKNLCRRRLTAGDGTLHVLGATCPHLNLSGYKSYATSRAGASFTVGLFDLATTRPVAVIEADNLGRIRTGAATGVATRHLARADAATLGLFGTGRQARTQLDAVCAVRPIRRVLVYSRNADNRRRFADGAAGRVAAQVVAVDDPAEAAAADVVVTATTSKNPVVLGKWLKPGAHLNVIGSNYAFKAEVDVEAVRRADRVVVDSREQCKDEAGDLIQAVAAGGMRWDHTAELGEIVIGFWPGRRTAEEITLFKSVGLGVEDVAAAAVVVRKLQQTPEPRPCHAAADSP